MRYFLSFAALCMAFFLNAQDQDRISMDSIPSDIAKKIFVYNASMQYNDPVVTRMAIYDLLAENPNNISLRDSLAMVYLQQQMYASAALVSQEIVNAVPDDMFAAEIAAISFERLGVKAKALKFYEKLYLNNTEDINKLYKMAFLQMDLKLYEESITSADQLMEHKLAKETTLIFPTEDGKGQEVGMNVAALRLKALVERARNNDDKAVEHLQAALKIDPNFEVAKNLLTEINQ